MKTNVYIDGFNFYYGCFRPRPKNEKAKWVDFRALSQALLPNDTIDRVHYFTARAKTAWDPGGSLRQETYIRALRGCPKFYVHESNFQAVQRKGVITNTPGCGLVVIDTWEEKGSDVNLATKLLVEAFDGDFEQALVISNDTDLLEPIRVVRQKFGCSVVVVSPHASVTSKMKQAATTAFPLDHGLLAKCQLPDPAKDGKGKLVTKPLVW